MPSSCRASRASRSPRSATGTSSGQPRLRASSGSPRVFGDYRALLDDGAYDLVTVCTMPDTHRTMTLDALECGAHVLCEKPFALDAVAGARDDRGGRARRPHALGRLQHALHGRRARACGASSRTGSSAGPSAAAAGCSPATSRGGASTTSRRSPAAGRWRPRPSTSSILRPGSSAARSRSPQPPRPRRSSRASGEPGRRARRRARPTTSMTCSSATCASRAASGSRSRGRGSGTSRAGTTASISSGTRARPAWIRCASRSSGTEHPSTSRATPRAGWSSRPRSRASWQTSSSAIREGREPLVRAREALVVQAITDALYRSAEAGREVDVVVPA